METTSFAGVPVVVLADEEADIAGSAVAAGDADVRAVASGDAATADGGLVPTDGDVAAGTAVDGVPPVVELPDAPQDTSSTISRSAGIGRRIVPPWKTSHHKDMITSTGYQRS
ncbi:MAG: hypothetical protein NVS4B8_20180 [Herpetosiphon sp.]